MTTSTILENRLLERAGKPSDGHPPRALWDQYACAAPVRLDRLEKGYSSDTWVARLSDGNRLVLRRYPGSCDAARLRFEHGILRYLWSRRFPTPSAISTRDGKSFMSMDEHYYALFEYCQGVMLKRPLWRRLRPQIYAAAGRTLAWYHRLMGEFQADEPDTFPRRGYGWFRDELARYRELISCRASKTSFDNYVLRYISEIDDELSCFGRALDPRKDACEQTIIHGDFGPANVLFRNGEVAGVLDFANTRFGARVGDVTYALIAFSKLSKPDLNLRLAKIFLSNYQKQHPLKEEELELVPSLMIYNRLKHLWWALLHYYDKGLPRASDWFVDSLALIHWLKDHEHEVRSLLEKSLRPAKATGVLPHHEN